MSTSRLFQAIVGFGIALGTSTAAIGCAAPTDEASASAEAADTHDGHGHDRFCEIAWPTTKGAGPRPDDAHECIDPHHQCGAYPGVIPQSDVMDEATLRLPASAGAHVETTGHARVGAGLRVEYAIERLPQCRTAGTAWNVTGFYSENGGPAQTFEITELTPDGQRVARAARIVPTAGGDVALWFKVSNASGCEQYDSDFARNFHVAVKENPSAPGTYETCRTKEASGTCVAGAHEAWLSCTVGPQGPRWTCPRGTLRQSQCVPAAPP